MRRAWLAEFLTRKTLPKDAAKVIALGLTIHRRDVGSATANGNELAHQLLGIERGGYYDDKLAAHVEQSPTKAQHVSLAVVLGGIESATSKSTWRYPEATKAAYLAQLGLYAQIAGQLFPGRTIEAAILWTSLELLMNLPAARLRQAVSGFTIG